MICVKKVATEAEIIRAERFTSLLDMFDGGGMGAEGNTFKGGGLLSDIANALFQPAGYRERQRGRAETRPRARPMSMGTQSPAQVQPTFDGPAGAGGTLRGPGMPGGPMPPMPTPGGNPSMMPIGGQTAPAPMMPPAEMQYSGRGSAGMTMPLALTPQEREVIEYLRSIGAIDY